MSLAGGPPSVVLDAKGSGIQSFCHFWKFTVKKLIVLARSVVLSVSTWEIMSSSLLKSLALCAATITLRALHPQSPAQPRSISVEPSGPILPPWSATSGALPFLVFLAGGDPSLFSCSRLLPPSDSPAPFISSSSWVSSFVAATSDSYFNVGVIMSSTGSSWSADHHFVPLTLCSFSFSSADGMRFFCHLWIVRWHVEDPQVSSYA